MTECHQDHCITCGDIAVPLRVTALHGDGTATAVDQSHAAERISIELVDARPGDWVLVHAGVAIAGATA